MAIIIWFLLLAGLTVGVFYGSAWLLAYVDYKSRPREPMEWCHKHGHFRKGHCLPLAGTLYCPQCYLEAMQQAKRQ